MEKVHFFIFILIGGAFLFLNSCGDDGESTTGPQNQNPIISSIDCSSDTVMIGGISNITVTASDPDGDALNYSYTATGGTISGNDNTAVFTAGNTPGNASVSVTVSDGRGGEAQSSTTLVVELRLPTVLPLFQSYLSLDGVDDYAEIASFEENTGSLTLEAWVYFETFDEVPIIEKEGAYLLKSKFSTQGNYTYRGILILLQGVGMSGGSITQYGSGGFWGGGWHHVAGVFNAGTGYLATFIDGEEQSHWDSGENSFINSNGQLQIGMELHGKVDEVRISDIARYSSGFTVPNTPFEKDEHTLALWHFDEDIGATSFYDYSGNNNILSGKNGAKIGRN